MATILEFPQRAGSRSNEVRGAHGEVVLFPGIRYERKAAQPKTKKRVKRRDRLEIKD